VSAFCFLFFSFLIVKQCVEEEEESISRKTEW